MVHWYIIPIGVELGMDPAVLKNFSHFVEIIEFAMTNAKRTDADLFYLQEFNHQIFVRLWGKLKLLNGHVIPLKQRIKYSDNHFGLRYV